ncbi:MAG: response regulator [Myxococcaceae bacterium]|nr:response regulator [Myxococcaceae bacterium]
MSRVTVLVVDDEAEVCELVARTLTRAGHEVLTATTGEAGLTMLDAGPIDCLVVDKHLPGMHGGEVMAEARRRLPHLAVVLISGHPEPLSFDDARPDVTLSKPFKSLTAIEEAVAQALAASRAAVPVVETLKERLTQVVAEIAPLRRKRE